MLRNEKTSLSKSSAGSLIFFAKQANGKLRIMVDYGGLNVITIKDKYPLPVMTTLMEHVGTSQVFSKLALKLGFHLLRIAKGKNGKRPLRPATDYTSIPAPLCPSGNIIPFLNA